MFAVTDLDSKDKTFIVYIIFINPNTNIYSFYKTQIAYLKDD